MKNTLAVFCALGWAYNAGQFVEKKDAPAAAGNVALAVIAGAWLLKRLK